MQMESWLRSCLLDEFQNSQIQRMRLIFRFLGQHLVIRAYNYCVTAAADCIQKPQRLLSHSY